MSLSSDLRQISNSIDNLLDVYPWTHKEQDFYQMLIYKVEQYSEAIDSEPAAAPAAPTATIRKLQRVVVTKPKPGAPKLAPKPVINDITEIRNNIIEQSWFKSSANQGIITKLLDSLKVVKCVEHDVATEDAYAFSLVLSFHGKLQLHIVMSGCYPLCRFRLYFEDPDSENKAFIAAYSYNSKKGHTLPEYAKLCKLFPSLTRAEIICFSSEILLYYDVHHVMKNIPIGNRYPITLPDLLRKVQQLI
jgi:hypothetical protein